MPCPAYIRGNSSPWRTPLELHLAAGAERSIDLRTAGFEVTREAADPFGPHTNSQRTRSPSSFAFPPSTSLFFIMLVSRLTKVVHNKAGDIQFLISDLTGDCGFLISILDP